jgi:hypothetical protein
MATKAVEYRNTVEVTVDEAKFDETFMREFRAVMYPFHTLDQHIEHLGQLFARGIVDNFSFIEGYGPAKDMGISFRDRREAEVEIVAVT